MEKIKSKRGMVNNITAIAFAIIGLVILVGIGITVADKLQTNVACSTGFTYNATDTSCINSSGTTGFATSTASTGIRYGITQLGSTGLLSWLPAVIALLIGVFFLAYFAGRQKGTAY